MPSLGLSLGNSHIRPAAPGLLDDFPGAAAAYSLRALGRNWVAGDVVEVRRSSDSATQDFTAAQVIDGTLTTFTGAGDGFVSTWYDQSGNADDATQPTTTMQPKIVDAGSLNVDVNGLPTMVLDGVDDRLNFANASFDIGSASTYSVCRHGSTGDGDASFAHSTSTNSKRWYSVFTSGGNFNFGYAASTTAISAGSDDTSQHLFSLNAGATVEGFKDGVSQGTAAASSGYANNIHKIGAISGGSHWAGDISEILVYNSDQGASVAGINAALVSHYSL